MSLDRQVLPIYLCKVLALIVVASPVAGGGNLLSNGGLEFNTEPWEPFFGEVIHEPAEGSETLGSMRLRAEDRTGDRYRAEANHPTCFNGPFPEGDVTFSAAAKDNHEGYVDLTIFLWPEMNCQGAPPTAASTALGLQAGEDWETIIHTPPSFGFAAGSVTVTLGIDTRSPSTFEEQPLVDGVLETLFDDLVLTSSVVPPDDLLPCVRDNLTACLLAPPNGRGVPPAIGRFEVIVTMRDFANPPDGPGNLFPGMIQFYDGASSETNQAVSFYSFEEGNVEIFVKMVDACSSGFNSFWVFAAGATTAETVILIRDTWTGQVYRIDNPRGVDFFLAPDTQAFKTCDALPPNV